MVAVSWETFQNLSHFFPQNTVILKKKKVIFNIYLLTFLIMK